MSEATEPQAPPKTTVGIDIDGKHFEAKPGELLIAAAERAGTYIPRFCWHPRMREVGMCRMCLVEVDGPRGPALQPACMLPVNEGMKVITQSPTVKKAQDGVLEFLLVNHPIDCPVCDKGGECPLQDQTMTFGPGETRFVEEKRHFEKPIAISDLVNLDRERCILCDRCTRFSKEVAGDPLIHFINRGNNTEVNTFPDDPYASYFSGNVVQICPVGALTAQPYRFVARPWDIDQVESTCTSCSVGCRVVLQSSGDRITRVQGVDADPVNWGWLCDKGRFDKDSVHSEERLTHPMVRKAGGSAPVQVQWYEALETAASVLRNLAPEQIGVIGGARLTNEDQYAWAKLLKGGLGIDNIDAQLGDGLSPATWLGTPQATIDEACAASLVIMLGPDIKEELPVLFLRLRDAATNRRVPIIEISPKGTGMSRYVAHSLQHRPGEAPALVSALIAAMGGSPVDRQVAGVEAEALTAAAKAFTAALDGGKGNGKIVIVAGRTSLSESVTSIEEALGALLAHAGARGSVLGAPRRSNVRGALDMGLAPGLLPGRVTRSAASAWFTGHWGRVPAADGLDTIAMLKAAADGRIKALLLLGSDPLTDVADRTLVDAAFAKVEHIVAVDTFANASVSRAAVILPAAGYGEKNGSTTNLEGRVSRLAAKVSAPGVARPDWMIAVELGSRLGIDLGVESVDELTDEIARVAPSHLGLTLAALTAPGAGNGIVAPLPAPVVEAEPEVPAEATSTEAAIATGSTDQTAESEAGEPVEAAPVVPAQLTAGPSPTAVVPQPDSYSLRLVSSHLLYDDGTTLGHSAALAKLAPGVSLRLHPGEIERHGLRAGGTVKVRSQRTAVVLTVIEDSQVPRGSAFVPFGQAGTAASELIDIDELASTGVVKVRLETVGEG